MQYPLKHTFFFCGLKPYVEVKQREHFLEGNQSFFFFFSFLQLSIHLNCLGQGGLCSLEELHSVFGMDGLQVWVPFPLFAVPRWCVEREAAGLGSIPLSIDSLGCAAARGVGGRGRVFTLPL